MTLIRTTIGRTRDVSCFSEPGCHVAAGGYRGVVRLGGAHALVHIASRERRRLRPTHLECRRGPHGIPFLLGDNTNEVSLTHHPRARDILDRAFVNGER